MKPSNKCLDFIKNEEGFRSEAYLDAAGIPTIGYGTIKYPTGLRVKMGDHITKGDANECLEFEVNIKADRVAAALAGIAINQNQFDACVSFAYNEGVGGFLDSTLLKRIKANPLDPSIRDAFAMWNKVTVNGKKIVSDGLVARREREADLYFS